MDLRGQDHKRIVLPSSFIYNPPVRDPPSKVPSIFSTVRRDGGASGNGGTSFFSTSSPAFDHHQHQHQHQHQHHHNSQLHPQQTQQSPPTPTPPSHPSHPPQPQQQQQHHHQQQQQQQQQASTAAPAPSHPPGIPQPLRVPVPVSVPVPDPEPEPEEEPDPVPVSIAVTSVSVATTTPITGGSNPRTPTIRNEFSSIRYRECLKNHAASIGGHVVDGCGEFMPGGEEGTPEALKCAACECHRNFHRKESDGEPQSGANYYYSYNRNSKANGSRSRVLHPPLSAPPIPQPIQQQQQKFPLGLASSPPSGLMPPMMMAFGGGAGSAATDSSSDEMNAYHTNATGSGAHPTAPQYGSSSSKKRFRTKFSKEQKDKMLEFAEKVGWRMQKQDEPAVQQFCAEVGVKRQVLKVWMHNNKHSMKKKDEM